MIGGTSDLSVSQQIQALPGLQAYWKLTDISGLIAVNAAGNAAFNGAYVNTPSLASTVFPVDLPVASFNGTNEGVNIYSAALANAFNAATGWLLLFFSDPSPSGSGGTLAFIYADGNNQITFTRSDTYRYTLSYKAAGVINYSIMDSEWTGFHMVALSWDKPNNTVRYWFDGVPSAEWGLSPMGTWVGALNSSLVNLAATNSSGSGSFPGSVGHAAIGAGAVLTDTLVSNIFIAVFPASKAMAFAGDSKTFQDSWIGRLTGSVGNHDGMIWRPASPIFAINGYTVAQLHTFVDANISAIKGVPSIVCINIGINDATSLPAEATWKGHLTAIINDFRAAAAGVQIYISRIWFRTNPTNCATINGWINDVIALNSAFCHAGPDESIWLENGDNGVTYTSDGTHYNAAGETAAVAQWLTALGY
jgi:hypothetical protein